MMLIVAIASVIFSLLYFNRLLKKKIQLTTGDEKITEMYPIRISESIYMYVVGTLLNQGKQSFFLIWPNFIQNKIDVIQQAVIITNSL
jgi:hypothetical protein